MMMTVLLIAAQTTTIVSVIVYASIRIEHRLTKVETEINWLKVLYKNKHCNEDEDHG